MDGEIRIESENNPQCLPKTTPILKSTENKDEETVPSASKKKKKGVSNPQWLFDSQLGSFLREYEPNSTKVLCIACNEPFSIHYGGKNNIDRHIKLKRHINNIKSFNIQ